MNTIAQSVQIAKDMCSKTSKYRYLYGGKGQAYTSALVRQLASLYPSYFNPIKYAMEDADKGFYAMDCSGFVSKVLGLSSQGSYAFYANAVKRLAVTKANAKVGMALWRSGHIAFVGDDLKIYEFAGTIVDWKVSTWEERAKDFTYLLVVKGSALANGDTYKGSATTPSAPTTSAGAYYPKYTGKATTLDSILKTVGVPVQYTGSYAKRKPLASKNGIANYTGSLDQNTKLINLAKAGKLVRV